MTEKEEIRHEDDGQPAGSQDAGHLRRPGGRVGEVLEAPDARDDVEAVVFERKALPCTEDDVGARDTLACSLDGHVRDVDARDLEASRLGVGQELALSAGDVEELASRRFMGQSDKPVVEAGLTLVELGRASGGEALLVPAVVPLLKPLLSHGCSATPV